MRGGEERREGKSIPVSSHFRSWTFSTSYVECVERDSKAGVG